jgi:hypothetical protein
VAKPKQALDKHSKGLFLRDLAEVRKGSSTKVFALARHVVEVHAFSLIGTERTLDMLCKSEGERDWFVEGFQLLISVLSKKEQEKRKESMSRSRVSSRLSSRWSNADVAPRLSKSQLDEVRELLHRGVPVIKHTISASSLFGKGFQSHPRMLWLEGGRLYIDHKLRGTSKGTEKGVNLADISQVRLGASSFTFDNGQLDPATYPKCLSIVASERTIDIDLNTTGLRDQIAAGLRHLVAATRESDDRRGGKWSSSS